MKGGAFRRRARNFIQKKEFGLSRLIRHKFIIILSILRILSNQVFPSFLHNFFWAWQGNGSRNSAQEIDGAHLAPPRLARATKRHKVVHFFLNLHHCWWGIALYSVCSQARGTTGSVDLHYHLCSCLGLHGLHSSRQQQV